MRASSWYLCLIKIDRALVSGIDGDSVKQAIVDGILGTARALGITVIGEGVETEMEAAALQDAGITLMQGFLFARPRLEGWFRPGEIAYPAGVSAPLPGVSAAE